MYTRMYGVDLSVLFMKHLNIVQPYNQFMLVIKKLSNTVGGIGLVYALAVCQHLPL